MQHYVYILYSTSRDRYYVGSASDIEQRLMRHNAGATPSTKPGRPWKLVYSEDFTTRSDALKREMQIKRQKSRIYIEQLIGNLDR